jgi:hypothetical protein
MPRFVQGMTNRYGMLSGEVERGHQAALEQLWHLGYREASTLAFAGATLLVPFLRKVAAPKTAAADAHCAVLVNWRWAISALVRLFALGCTLWPAVHSNR